MKRIFAVLTTALMAGLIAPPPSNAQSSDSGPAMGVARISLTNGDVTTRRGDSGDWVAASVNTPLVEGDIIETGPGSRVEIQLDYSNLIRLDGSSTLEIAELGDRRFRVRLLDGRATYSELRGGEADVDIETPFVAVRPRENGRYEIEVQPGQTVVQVRRGEAEVAMQDGVEKVNKGHLLAIRQGEDGRLDLRDGRDEPSSEWDQWNQMRDERLAKSESYRYVSRSVTGADDLDYYGDWSYVSGYGNCWYPRVNAGWSPYRNGRWTWVDYYGWSWVGYEPWGWAPYHYGRWFYSPVRGWGWWPGQSHYRYHWRPALVAFFGYSGRNFSVGVGFGYGNVGWVPLAPYETYYPWYGRGGYYGGRYGGGYGGRGGNTIIVDNSVNIYNTYRNARINNGVTVVDSNGFGRGQLNNPRSLRGEELQRASLMRGQIPVVPERGSLGQVVNRSARQGNSMAARAGDVRTFRATMAALRRQASARTGSVRPAAHADRKLRARLP
ncbi:MAG: FecR family protein [Bryobacterales bacterium]